MLQLGLGGLADKIRGSIDARNRAVTPAQGAGAGLAANQASMGASPTAQGQAAGAAAAQAATNASAGAQPLRSFARGQAMAPRPMMPGAQGPDYGLGAPLTTPSAPTPRPAVQPAPPTAAGPAPGQAPMVDPGAMVATLNTPEISPKTHMAHEVGGQSVLLRNGADPRNPGPGDLLTYDNGQWVPADPSLGNDLYEQLHITPE
jgi:hypothetical protein